MKPRLDALAGLRFVAALVVAVAHLPEISHDPALGRVANRMLGEGVYGLTFFFVLSGFVLAYGYLDRLANPTYPALGNYYVARIARIWPLHLLALAVVLVLPTGPWNGGIGPLVANLTLVHAWVPDLDYIQSFNSVSWTLSLEFFFYLVFPFLIFGLGKWKSAGPVRLYLAAFGVWLLTLAVVLPFAWQEGLWPLYICNVCPAVRVGEFAVGVFLGVAFVRGRTRSGPVATRYSPRFWTALELGVVAVLVFQIFRAHRIPLLFRMNGYYIPVVAALVFVFARERGRLSRCLATPTAVYLSELSFAFYLLHAIVFTHLRATASSYLGVYAGAAVMVGVTALAAMAAHHLVERPLRERILHWWKPKPSSRPIVDETTIRRAA